MQTQKTIILLFLLVTALSQDLTALFNLISNLQTQIQQLQNRKPQVIRIPSVDLSN